MNRFALIIGLEHYAEKITSVKYAENDANELSDCFLQLGFDARDVTTVISAQATKTKIESELRRLAKLAQENDAIFVFFSGHGISINGTNYITCHDTVRTDFVNTCISIKLILDVLKSSKSKRLILFLDSCHSGLNVDESMRGVIESLSETELQDFFASAEYEVGFAACRTDEFSYSSPNLRHGIWTYHLIEALRGNAPGAVEKNKHITSTSLQNHLSLEVPKTLKVQHPDRVTQTPICFGGFSREFQLFNLEQLLAKKDAERKARIGALKAVSLLGSTGGSILDLSGFRKGYHHIPKSHDGYTASFVESIAADDLKKEAKELHDKLKKNFGYKRKESRLEIESSSAVITTRDFELSIFYTQDGDDPGKYTAAYKLTNIKDPEALLDPGLQSVLADHFDEVELSVTGSIDVEAIIDTIESSERDDIEIDYPTDCSSLTIRGGGCNWHIHCTVSSLSIISEYLESPEQLLNYVKEGYSLIAGDPILRLMIE